MGHDVCTLLVLAGIAAIRKHLPEISSRVICSSTDQNRSVFRLTELLLRSEFEISPLHLLYMASVCQHDDKIYFETASDASCQLTPTVNGPE